MSSAFPATLANWRPSGVTSRLLYVVFDDRSEASLAGIRSSTSSNMAVACASHSPSGSIRLQECRQVTDAVLLAAAMQRNGQPTTLDILFVRYPGVRRLRMKKERRPGRGERFSYVQVSISA